MKNNLFIVTAVATIGLASAAFSTAAFAQSGQSYPAPLHTFATTPLNAVSMLPQTSGESGAESVNSRPANFVAGTEPGVDAQILARWQAQQTQSGYAEAPAPAQANGG